MRKITALIDGSVYSHSVCDHAAWVAGRTDRSIEILHVLGRRHLSSSTQNLSGQIGLGARSALLKELSDHDAQSAKLAKVRGRAILDDARKHLEDAGIEKVETHLRHGGVVESVHEIEDETDLIVIGKRGEAADFDKGHIGSNLERVVRATKKPVLVASRAFKPVNRVLIAFDGGKSVMKAVEHLAASKLLQDTHISLLTVGEPKTETSRQLDGAATLLKDAGFSVESTIKPGQPEAVIAATVEEGKYDLLVIGAYGHSRIRTMIIGSTTTHMIRDCKVPLMLFR
ncbi:universal stress protein [Aquisalinus flavus]|uniref:Universal stress protein UspA n=1 Tax=Aquisalinus flavus TaxID=1526572 RepID=A0A8J2V405_9PROT|nr:universal stress protein [Aquisalinus flavus]MBD0427464.1 universal stress protein [Aquisalinus flavus]UNE47264.1 universal stress protein [Aquisalinus flavus]GGD01213.1 universal stress protein UspA [Aquisalinus flavus]